MKMPKLTTLLFVIASLLVFPELSQSTAHAEQVELAKKARYRGDVILIKGGFNVFSDGLDTIAGKLRKRGLKVHVRRHSEYQSIAAGIIANQKKHGRKPIVLIGHSWGANSAIKIAKILRKKRLRVNYLASFAATDPEPVPSNVRKLTNYYFKTDGWGKPVKRGRGFRGTLKNIDMSKKKSVHHFNVEQQPRLQSQVIRNVLRHFRSKRLG